LHKDTIRLKNTMQHHFDQTRESFDKITKNMGKLTSDVDAAVATVYEHIEKSTTSENADLKRHLSKVESMTTVLGTAKTEPPATVAERRTSFNDDDEYWDGDYHTSFDEDEYLDLDEKFDNDSPFEEQTDVQNKPLPPVPHKWPTAPYKFEALYDFDSSEYGEGHLTFKARDQFYSESETSSDGWLTVTQGMSTGKVPFNYLKECVD